MYFNVTAAKHVGGFRVALTFADGTGGVADLEKYAQRGGVFEKLKNPRIFADFRLNEDFGTICWGEDLDIAPEALYELVVSQPAPNAAMVAETKSIYGNDAVL